MTTFKIMTDRIALELRRSNMLVEIGNAINDAILEAAQTRFYFNEIRDATFVTVPGQEYYSDLGLVEIDILWFQNGGSRENVALESNLDADMYASGNVSSGQLSAYSRQGEMLRFWPVPSTVYTVHVDGFGNLAPFPLVNDGDSNAWLVQGERYIRALAKRNLLRDIIRDYGEASVLDAVAEDYKDTLISETNMRLGTGRVKGTCW